MSVHQAKSKSLGAIGTMNWPLLLGAASCSVFYVMILRGPLQSPFMYRYFASHPVLYFETGMFFVGLAALLVKSLELASQSAAFRRISLDETPEGEPASICAGMLAQMESLPASLRRTYLGGRILNALRYIERKGAADGLDEELKYFADLDGARQQESYSLVRILAWAIPMLGFLGTVIGITQALGGMDFKLFASDIAAAMEGLLAGLYVAFDTTALALVLSMVLMFYMFFTDRIETSLLGAVDERVLETVVRRFPADAGRTLGYLRAVERMSAAVIKTTETLIRQQTEQWKGVMEQTNQLLAAAAVATGEQIRGAVGESLDASLKNHAERLARFEYEADQQMRARWDQWQGALAENVRVLRDQQGEVARQTEVLQKMIAATGEIIPLEKSLNQNLQALVATRRFEDTVLSLSAAIQLLSARTSALPESSTLEIRSTTQGRAA